MTYRLLIDGELVDGAATLEVVNPATGAVFATCARADADQLERAVAAAKRSFPAWSALGAEKRGDCLARLADRFEERKEEFARLLTTEQGKPLAQARIEIGNALAVLRYYAGMEIPPIVLRESATDKIIEHRTPLGVVAAITPWNFPMSLLLVKVAPALSAGNTMVAKPAPTTPLTSLLFGELAAETLPAGVLNIVTDANDLGARLTAHPDIAKVAFTGSTATGKRVVQSASESLKRVTLELGGNDAAIVLDDIDVVVAAKKVFDAAMVNCGQVCLAAKRVYAPRAMYDALCAELARLSAIAVVDDGLNQGTQIGPLQNRQQYDKVLEMIESARTDGTILVGGMPLDRPGFFVAPTVVRDIPDDARLVREEQFGPIIPVLAYDTIDEVIDRANDSEYGLGGTIWTGDVERGTALAMRIDTGTVWVNKHLELPTDVPFGGAKQSGIGREKGIDGFKEFTQGKIVNVAKTPLVVAA
jgi:acyl-CoA reductase-like NAD-dependent aldehyde dehydrogenase